MIPSSLWLSPPQPANVLSITLTVTTTTSLYNLRDSASIIIFYSLHMQPLKKKCAQIMKAKNPKHRTEIKRLWWTQPKRMHQVRHGILIACWKKQLLWFYAIFFDLSSAQLCEGGSLGGLEHGRNFWWNHAGAAI